jgi:hypothetical protein
VTPWLLALLVLVDGTLCGFRVAAGRNPRLFLRGYYLASMRRAALVAVVVLTGFSGLALAVHATDEAAWRALLTGADALVHVYGVFATLVVGALALYLIGSFDLGVLATVLVLGPFTLLRPFVIVAGAAWAAWCADSAAAGSFCVAGALTMLAFERLLELGSPPWRGLLPRQ